ncbi:MAG: 3-methyl-2-oxobutanoate dehydrogenase (2-methylpropanoyl-transferring) subunit alpha [Acidimicrobiia bacterium]|nr:3-methyl-2-oxobutanoate dehydrogenase (2-methylpropanoyl-transferring) subunit alpha [Acidimicrobiia bacterium]
MTETQPMKLSVPEPAARPGDEPNFSHIIITPAGELPKPPIDVAPGDTRSYAGAVIRVLDDNGRPVGEWAPDLTDELKRRALRHLLETRVFDEQAMLLQRQGKAGFAIQSRGEEAVSVGAALAVDATSPGYGQGLDMHFPTYRQSGLLMANGHSLLEMFCQILSNTGDRLKGAQLPSMHSVPEKGFFSISGNLATQLIQAVGWAMASAIEGKRNVALAWTGEGATAENDFHSALVFAKVYQPPVILNIINNQWAISSFQGIAGGEAATFAQRGSGYGLPTLRADGNDLLAVYAVTDWAVRRARAGYGPTLIEWVTYRAGSHSSSDDPSRYRSADAASSWPLGDPIERLSEHLRVTGAATDTDIEAIRAEVTERLDATLTEAEKLGTMNSGPRLSASHMFEHVYAEIPRHLREQRQELGI